MNKKIILLILIAFTVMLCSNCGKDSPPTEDQIKNNEPAKKETVPSADPADSKKILIINEKSYTNKELKDYIQHHYSESDIIEKNPKLASRIFDIFIEQKMISYMVDQEEIPLDQEEIEKYLKDKHLSMKSAEDPWVIENIRSQKYLYFKLYKDIDVTDAEIRKYYNDNMQQFRRSPEVFLHQIVVKTKDKALEIREELNKSPDKFADLARADSIARDKDQGGEMGYFQKGTLPEDMERVVFALSPNAISPVVESPYGFHIFKVTKVKKERLLYLDAVRNDIKNELLSDKIRWSYEDFLSQLRTQLEIQVLHQALYFVYQPTKGDENNENNQNAQPTSTNND